MISRGVIAQCVPLHRIGGPKQRTNAASPTLIGDRGGEFRRPRASAHRVAGRLRLAVGSSSMAGTVAREIGVIVAVRCVAGGGPPVMSSVKHKNICVRAL